MARSFNGSSQKVEAAASALGTGTLTTFTFACWLRPSSAANGTALGIGDSNSDHYIALGATASNVVFVEVSAGGGASSASGGTLTSGVWNHIAGVQSSATNRVAYLNGAGGSANTVSRSPSGMDRTTIGALVISGSTFSWRNGEIAEAGIWDVALDAAELAALAKGVSPLLIRPESLVFYAPVLGNASPEQDLSGGLSLTVTGATKADVHPRVLRQPAVPASAPAATGGGVARDLTGAAPAASSASGSTSVARPLSGSGNAASGAAGALARARPVTGSAAAASGASGSLSVTRAVAGSSPSAAGASGALAGTRPLNGSAPAASGATGSLSTAGDAALTGTAPAASGATGALTVARPLTAAAPAAGSAVAQLAAQRRLIASASAASVFAGALTLARPLTGRASASASATGALSSTGDDNFVCQDLAGVVSAVQYSGAVSAVAHEGAVSAVAYSGDVGAVSYSGEVSVCGR